MIVALTPTELSDAGFGPRMVPVAPPGVTISPISTLKPDSLGKVPGRLTQSGWTGVSTHDLKQRCHDYATAKKWQEVWGANVGFVAGDGYVIIDNDQGAEFSQFLSDLCVDLKINAPRRFVHAPKHKRDAFFFRVLDFVGDPSRISAKNITFRNGTRVGKIQILASDGQQLVISGIHPGTNSPYVWDRKLASIDEIPNVAEDLFAELIRKFVELLDAAGWKPDAGVSVSLATQSPGPAAIAAPNMAIATPTPQELADTKALLDQIPNRDLPPGEKPNAIDIWLDYYRNWLSVAYALSAHLGAGAGSPEAEELWVDWSDGRTQISQSSRGTWRSVRQQPPRMGNIKLVSLVRELGALPPASFPPVDPNDPALQSTRPTWDKMRKRWALFTPKGGFLNMDDAQVVSRQAFSDLHADQARALADELGYKRKGANAAGMFASQKDKLIVGNLTYHPGAERLIPTSTYPLFNKWRPTEVAPRPVTQDEAKTWLDHVHFVLGADSDLFVKWCAFVAQHPELKPNWHYLIMSVQGLGKDTMLAPVKAAVGVKNTKEALVRQVSDGFNDVLESKLLIVGETHQPRWTSHEVSSNLKHILARPPETNTINLKHLARYEIPNLVAVIMFSNDRNPLQLESGQRRVHVINRRDLKPQTLSYYKGLWGWLKQGGAELAASYLLTLPLSDAEMGDFIGGNAPGSNDKSELEELNVDSTLAVLENLITDSQDGLGPFHSLLATADELAEQIGPRMNGRRPTAQIVTGLLLDLERQGGKGVRRVRVDPKHPNRCAVIFATGVSARLWQLADKAPSGQDWSALGSAQIIATYKGKTPPKSASILAFPSPAPDPPTPEEEKV